MPAGFQTSVERWVEMCPLGGPIVFECHHKISKGLNFLSHTHTHTHLQGGLGALQAFAPIFPPYQEEYYTCSET